MSVLNQAHFHNEEAAYEFIESRVWPDGPVCPHCGAGKDRVNKLKGKSTRMGTYKCYECRKPFTVKVGTIFESSHVKLHTWLQAMFLICSSKKGISANQLHRTLGVTLKTAWFMGHRIREALTDSDGLVFGTDGGTVEVDETFIGNDRSVKPKGQKKGRGYAHKHKVLSLIDRETGKARSMVVDSLKAKDVVPILQKNIDQGATVMTDEAAQYKRLTHEFARHEFVSHGIGEYGRGEVSTNTIEGFFSIFKRGMKGVYQHCAKEHLERYLAEYDFRYNAREALGVDDQQRTDFAIRGIKGKRLTYQTTHKA